jgi:predicted PurR-regulated permease PerM
MIKNEKKIEQIAGLVFIGVIVAGCLFVLQPFASVILWAAIVCFATWPLYQLLLKWLRRRRNLAAGLMTIVLSLVLFIPFLVISLTFTDNVRSAIGWLESHLEAGLPQPPGWVGRIPLVGESIIDYWSKLSENAELAGTWLKPWFKVAGVWLLRHSLDFAHGVFNLLMSLLIAFFLYRDGEGVVAYLSEGFKRISGDYAQHLMDVVKTTVQSVVYGVIGTGSAQGILAGIGFAIAGVPSPMLLALLTFFLSLFPFGPPIVWISASVWLFVQSQIGWGIFMVIYGLFVISSVDNFIRPYLISRGSKLPFVLMLLGVLGGVVAFGLIGIFLGPTLLAVGYSLMQEIVGQRHRTISSRHENKSEKARSITESPSSASAASQNFDTSGAKFSSSQDKQSSVAETGPKPGSKEVI